MLREMAESMEEWICDVEITPRFNKKREGWGQRKWRNGRVVECGGLENRCPAIAGPGVRIPLSPLRHYVN